MSNENWNEKEVKNYAENNLTKEQQNKIKEVLSNKEKLNQILSSPFAQEIIKKFNKKP